MRIVDALKARNHLAPVHDPASEGQRQARRQRQATQHAHAIVSTKEEIPRSELVFERHWIEHEPTGTFFRHFGGDAHYAETVRFYYVDSDGNPIMLEGCTNPSSRADVERIRARKEQRRADRAAVAKQRREQLKARTR